MVLDIFGLDSSGPERDHCDVFLLQLGGAVRGHPIAGGLADAVGDVEEGMVSAQRRHVHDEPGLGFSHQPEPQLMGIILT